MKFLNFYFHIKSVRIQFMRWKRCSFHCIAIAWWSFFGKSGRRWIPSRGSQRWCKFEIKKTRIIYFTHKIDFSQSLFFIDIGYVMEMTSEDDFEFFKLSEQAQQMSARAIRCKVVKVRFRNDKWSNNCLLNLIYCFHEDDWWIRI